MNSGLYAEYYDQILVLQKFHDVWLFDQNFFFFDYFEAASPIQLRMKSSVSLSRLDSVEYTETFFFL